MDCGGTVGNDIYSSRHHQGHVGSDSFLQQSPSVVNCKCWHTQIDLLKSHKTVMFVCCLQCFDAVRWAAWRACGL